MCVRIAVHSPLSLICVCVCALLMLCQSGPQPLTPLRCVCSCVCVSSYAVPFVSFSCLLPWHLPSQFIYFCLFLFSVFVIVAFCFWFCLFICWICVSFSRFALDYEINLWPFHKRVFLHTPHKDTHTHTPTRIHTCVCVQYISTYSVFMLVDFLRPAALYMRAAMRFDRNWHKRT